MICQMENLRMGTHELNLTYIFKCSKRYHMSLIDCLIWAYTPWYKKFKGMSPALKTSSWNLFCLVLFTGWNFPTIAKDERSFKLKQNYKFSCFSVLFCLSSALINIKYKWAVKIWDPLLPWLCLKKVRYSILLFCFVSDFLLTWQNK